ncbi:hypothetical protein [Pseudobacteriovorax antillogorgiicola]|uniref:Lipoprotein n=1 Tax=Pseudobacteriovorax antillogorgiicola TaxID=1513793 RepID=A0A1Y6BZD0_9BACT|nr:hypothetical protein [Pseudobacteriovorax antillogorgiicola]TCS52457.1 hypothetical protein EDD56_109202 [Pseudobacteriovorax antillogorgiicola]SMF28449.1 hypothetical protein SAMN06296036_10912 [Pseudobacteriovorax antillogorgiicola]
MGHPFLLAFVLLISSCASTSKPWTMGVVPKPNSDASEEQRQKIFQKYEIADWAGVDGTYFYLLGSAKEVDGYSLKSLRPTIEDLVPTLRQDLDEIESYDRAGDYAFYTSAGFFAVTAVGYGIDEPGVYKSGQTLGLLSLFAWIILEQFEWQVKDQVQFQYNEALRERLKIQEDFIDVSKNVTPVTPLGVLPVLMQSF